MFNTGLSISTIRLETDGGMGDVERMICLGKDIQWFGVLVSYGFEV